jgi:hypothetical protein
MVKYPHVMLSSKKEWSYNSTPPTRLHSDNFALIAVNPILLWSKAQDTPNRIWIRG